MSQKSWWKKWKVYQLSASELFFHNLVKSSWRDLQVCDEVSKRLECTWNRQPSEGLIIPQNVEN